MPEIELLSLRIYWQNHVTWLYHAAVYCLLYCLDKTLLEAG